MPWKTVTNIRMTLVLFLAFQTIHILTVLRKGKIPFLWTRHYQKWAHTHSHTHLPACFFRSQTAEREMDERPGGRYHQAGKQPVCHSELIAEHKFFFLFCFIIRSFLQFHFCHLDLLFWNLMLWILEPLIAERYFVIIDRNSNMCLRW